MELALSTPTKKVHHDDFIFLATIVVSGNGVAGVLVLCNAAAFKYIFRSSPTGLR